MAFIQEFNTGEENMPIYEFKCNKCGENFEEILFPSDDERNLRCPSCKGNDICKLVSCFSSGSGSGSASVGGDTISSGCTPRGGFS
jgi:putative FmdB family regulatory protein